jgi:hypothetical protein
MIELSYESFSFCTYFAKKYLDYKTLMNRFANDLYT